MQAELYKKMQQLEREHWWFRARRKIIDTTMRRTGIGEGNRILEVGCGTGGNIGFLTGFGELTCVEQDHAAVELAREETRVPVFQGGLPSHLPEFKQAFDVICLFDVIEHIDEDLESLQALLPLLAPGGRVVVTVPAFSFLWSRHDDENHHKRRYRKKDIQTLAQSAGFRLDYVSYFNFWLFLPVAAVRLIRKLLPYEEPWQDMRTPSPSINRLLERLFASERMLIGRGSFPFGVSLIAVMTKSA